MPPPGRSANRTYSRQAAGTDSRKPLRKFFNDFDIRFCLGHRFTGIDICLFPLKPMKRFQGQGFIEFVERFSHFETKLM